MRGSILFATFVALAQVAFGSDRQIALITRGDWDHVVRVEMANLDGDEPVVVSPQARKGPWAFVANVPKELKRFTITAKFQDRTDNSSVAAVYSTTGEESANTLMFDDGENSGNLGLSMYVMETGNVLHNRDVWTKFIQNEVFPRLGGSRRSEIEEGLPKYWAHHRAQNSGISLFLLGDGFAQPTEEKPWAKKHGLIMKYKPTHWSKSFHKRYFDTNGLFARITVKGESGTFSFSHRNLEHWASPRKYIEINGNDLQISDITVPVPAVQDEDNEEEMGHDPAASGDAPSLLVVPFTSNAVSEKFWREVESKRSKGRYWADGRWNRDELRKLWSKLRKEEPQVALDNVDVGMGNFGLVEKDDGVSKRMKFVILGVCVLLALCAGVAYFTCCPKDRDANEVSNGHLEPEAAQTASEWPLEGKTSAAKETSPQEAEFAIVGESSKRADADDKVAIV